MEEYDNIPDIQAQIQQLNHVYLNIGILDSSGSQLQMIAAVNNNGTTIYAKNVPYLMVPTKNPDGSASFRRLKSVNIPARRFLEQTIIDHQGEWQQGMVIAISNIVIGGLNAKDVMNQLGNEIVQNMKDEIKDWSQPENAPLTVARKGFNDPLIDTGKLHDSIAFEIVSE